MLKRRLEQIWQRKLVVLAVAVLGLALASLASLNAHSTFSGKSTLMVSSPGRAPDQDAFVAVGYATLFNDPATIVRLRADKPISPDVTFEARTAAASPILAIEATADNPKAAQDAAQEMAEAFRDDINSARQKENTQRLTDLRNQLDDLRNQPEPNGSANASIAPLQDLINTVRYDSTNQLENLQVRAGVVETTPNIALNLAMGTVGGLLLGVMAALGLAATSTRLTGSTEFREKTGLEPLAEIPSGGSVDRDRVREDQLSALANILTLEEMPKSPALALTDSYGVREASQLAGELATLTAQQGYRTVLMYADNRVLQPADDTGFADALADASRVHAILKDSALESLKILPCAGAFADRYSRVSRERIVAIIDELRTYADIIIIAAPPIEQTSGAQLLCGAADSSLLIVSRRSSRAGDVTSAVDVLSKARVNLLGAALVDETPGEQKQWAPAADQSQGHE